MKHVLIVDDAATVRLFHRNILEQAGYAVTEAVNGIEALEKALVAPFDAYLVDINMARLDGYGFLRELRSHDIVQGPAIMISTEAELSDSTRAYEAGANAYLQKPVNPGRLLTYLGLVLGDPVTP